jgi:hypothetical protein
MLLLSTILNFATRIRMRMPIHILTPLPSELLTDTIGPSGSYSTGPPGLTAEVLGRATRFIGLHRVLEEICCAGLGALQKQGDVAPAEAMAAEGGAQASTLHLR